MKHKREHSEKGGMRSARMPSDHFEHAQKQSPVVGEKYATEFGNPHSLDKMNDGLVNFTRKHRMPYE